ncbi:hypothetical protein OG786_11485 [Streptomyces sp. NBC_00101]|uniref:hypothetical protein n=1 Tax=Streptomyces sp. NBC_00101 TaxID=2975651 RepID=UPI003251FE03
MSTALLREQQPSSRGGSDTSGSPGASGGQGAPGPAEGPSAPAAPSDDNPFAAPPQGRPDQPWRPRHPQGQDGRTGQDPQGGGDGTGGGPPDSRPVWGSQWSDRQPGREGGDFGRRPGASGGPERPGGGRGSMRWDPTDPAQRRARYAVLSGMWAFFFVLFGFPEIALLLGALGTYWAISSLRADPKPPVPADGAAASAATAAPTAAGAPEPGSAPAGRPVPDPVPPGSAGKPQTTAAVSGLVTALLALVMVAGTFTVELVYRDYYTCVDDALTRSSALACNDLLPDPLEPLFGVKH